MTDSQALSRALARFKESQSPDPRFSERSPSGGPLPLVHDYHPLGITHRLRVFKVVHEACLILEGSPTTES